MAQTAIKLIKSDARQHRSAATTSSTADNGGDAPRLAKAYRELETSISDIGYMAQLVADAGEEVLGVDAETNEQLTGRKNAIFCPPERADMTLWAVYHLKEMIDELQKKYDAIDEG